MKKILLILSTLIMAINANEMAANALSSLSIQKTATLEDKINEAKTYSKLIHSLETSPVGEHALYLAIIYLNGINKPDSKGNTIKPDIEKSKQYFLKSIKLGYYNAAQILGTLYMYHKDFISDPHHLEKAEKYLNLAMKNGEYSGATVLADLYLNKKHEYKKGVEALKKGAEHNIATSQLMLAIMYNWGYVSADGKKQIVKIDKPAAQLLLTKACTNPNATEQVKKFCSSKSVKKEVKNSE